MIKSYQKKQIVSFLSTFRTINWPLFFVCICSFTVNTKSHRLQTRFWHILYLLCILSAYEFTIWMVFYSELKTLNIEEYTMSDILLNLAAVSMARMFTTIALFGVRSRTCQMDLVAAIIEVDERFTEDLPEMHEHYKQLCGRFMRQLIFVVSYKFIALIATSCTLADTLNRVLFFGCYSIADATFTVYVNYIVFCGKVVILRYELFIKRFQTFMEGAVFRGDVYVELLQEHDAIYKLKERLYRAFGSFILFTMLYHSFALAIAIFGIIITLNHTESYLVIAVSVLLYFIWLIPYFMRLFILGHVYEGFGRQVFVHSNQFFFLFVVFC